MNSDKSIKIDLFPDKKTAFMGFYVPEKCLCCEENNKTDLYTVHMNDTRTILCADCLNKLYKEIGKTLHQL